MSIAKEALSEVAAELCERAAELRGDTADDWQEGVHQERERRVAVIEAMATDLEQLAEDTL